ncbi:MAG: UDP-N-acetylmuramate--L-alanine ligase [Spirochaetales bacterium]|nr:UDP-N-acetylmuramate--L-alanine ligase [Spirochaetales bacterium]
MPERLLTHGLRGRRVHFTGIKGVGMAALAEIFFSRGADVEGSDTSEKFFTDDILRGLGIPVTEGFAAENLAPGTDFVVYSAAYDPERHPELLRAGELGIPRVSYPEALGELSTLFDSSGVSGVHGKTTTTALTGVLCREAALPVTVLVGSAVPGFGDRATSVGGDRYLVAETCEYKRHFLNFSPTRIVMTSVEMDHQDYFRDLDDIRGAFESYALKLKSNGILIYCADDDGASRVAGRVKSERPDIVLVPYGFQAEGDFRISEERFSSGTTRFRLSGFDGEFTLHVPGRHTVRNAAAALALALRIAADAGRPVDPGLIASCRRALEGFTGTRRRSEIVGEAAGILFIDDYAHHPTAIAATLAGLKDYHPHRRLVVDFMPHTYSRTSALLEAFAGSFSLADEVVLHKIYASARETNDGTVSGRTLFEGVSAVHPAARYFEEPDDAFSSLAVSLKKGDLFVTMGAGDNWKLGRDLYLHFSSQRSVS